jgi:hypothetical protein
VVASTESEESMSGESNYGGNGSIYWKVRHHNGRTLAIKDDNNEGWRRSGNGAKKAITRMPWSSTLEAGEWIEMTRVHNGELDGRDDDQNASRFTVTLRYDTSVDGTSGSDPVRRTAIIDLLKQLETDARAAWTAMQNDPAIDSRTIVAEVPVVSRRSRPTTDWEVSIAWK